jgi:hypothetical protein
MLLVDMLCLKHKNPDRLSDDEATQRLGSTTHQNKGTGLHRCARNDGPSDFALQGLKATALGCFAALAMTAVPGVLQQPLVIARRRAATTKQPSALALHGLKAKALGCFAALAMTGLATSLCKA